MLIFSGNALAGPRQSLNQFVRGLRGLSGQFTQQVVTAQGQVKESMSGSLVLSLPNRFRWEYQVPYQQLIIADGERVWIYDPDLQQVSVRSDVVPEQNIALLALSHPEALDLTYDVVESARARDGLQWLTLTPKPNKQTSFQVASLGLNRSGLVQMDITDTLGQRIVIQFTHWQRNPQLSDHAFRFTPPPGTDVIGQ